MHLKHLHPLFERDKQKYYCPNAKWVLGICGEYHGKLVMIRCRQYDSCITCKNYRKASILAKCYSRWDRLSPKPRETILWTFGTSLSDDLGNRRLLTDYWQIFRKRLWISSRRKGFSFKPLLWVGESGSRGNRLHIHALVEGFIPHNHLLEGWRKITGENSNVNYSRKQGGRPEMAFRYFAKYLAKEGSRYYWMGRLLKAKEDPYLRPVCEDCGSPFLWWIMEPYFDNAFRFELTDFEQFR